MEASYGQTDYEASEKTFHFCRRRRWMKQRKIDANAKVSMDLLVILLLFRLKIWIRVRLREIYPPYKDDLRRY